MIPRRPGSGDACETCFEETDDDPDLCRALPPTKVALDLKLELLGNSVKFGSNLLLHGRQDTNFGPACQECFKNLSWCSGDFIVTG